MFFTPSTGQCLSHDPADYRSDTYTINNERLNQVRKSRQQTVELQNIRDVNFWLQRNCGVYILLYGDITASSFPVVAWNLRCRKELLDISKHIKVSIYTPCIYYIWKCFYRLCKKHVILCWSEVAKTPLNGWYSDSPLIQINMWLIWYMHHVCKWYLPMLPYYAFDEMQTKGTKFEYTYFIGSCFSSPHQQGLQVVWIWESTLVKTIFRHRSCHDNVTPTFVHLCLHFEHITINNACYMIFIIQRVDGLSHETLCVAYVYVWQRFGYGFT